MRVDYVYVHRTNGAAACIVRLLMLHCTTLTHVLALVFVVSTLVRSTPGQHSISVRHRAIVSYAVSYRNAVSYGPLARSGVFIAQAASTTGEMLHWFNLVIVRIFRLGIFAFDHLIIE